MRTVALVSTAAEVDFFCYPYFDSPAIFCSILDRNIGGYFSLHPADPPDGIRTRQFYWPDTNVLITRFYTQDGMAAVYDYLPVGKESSPLMRRVVGIRGNMPFHCYCEPSFNWARSSHKTTLDSGGDCSCATFATEGLSMQLLAKEALRVRDGGSAVECHFETSERSVHTFIFREVPKAADKWYADLENEARTFDKTIKYWRSWISRCKYTGRWREMVHRSALVLKLCTSELTGGVVAAPTTSLPRVIGGARNIDLRSTWLRDAALTLYSLISLGFTEEACKFMAWIEARCKESHDPARPLQSMYGLDGRPVLLCEELTHLEGYKGSRPVRIGHTATEEFQLDIYGALMDTVYVFNENAAPVSFELWTHLRKLVNYVCDNWTRPDDPLTYIGRGLAAGEPQQFVFSKVMCWVALDRGLRLAESRSFPADRERWLKVRDQIYEDIMQKGWNEEMKCFVHWYGSDVLNAGCLIMPMVSFMAPNDPRMLSTLSRIMKSPEEGGLLVSSLVLISRDRLAPHEGTFNILSFWLVEALTRAGATNPASLAAARLMFEELLGYANHLGLYSEETGFHGEALGNFPHALAQISLISAAFNLNSALDRS
jgi:GH15 family glucan-1,4-alpha-glucosidase